RRGRAGRRPRRCNRGRRGRAGRRPRRCNRGRRGRGGRRPGRCSRGRRGRGGRRRRRGGRGRRGRGGGRRGGRGRGGRGRGGGGRRRRRDLDRSEARRSGNALGDARAHRASEQEIDVRESTAQQLAVAHDRAARGDDGARVAARLPVVALVDRGRVAVRVGRAE